MLFDCPEHGQQAAAIRQLDGQPRPGVELQHQWAVMAIQHHIHTQIAQPGQVITAGGEQQERVPAGNANPGQRRAGIGMAGNPSVLTDAILGDPAGQLDSGADRSLMEIGLAVR